MSFGIKKDGEKVICLNCDVVVGKGETKFNFCPKCGSPLNFKAGTFEEKKINREKLKLLYEIVDECENDYENKLKQCIKELEEEI